MTDAQQSSHTFEDAVRALARHEGHHVAADTPVTVTYGTTESGHSEFTVTSTWEELEVTCGTFTRHYETRAESMITASPLNAFAALLADLDTPRALPASVAVLAATAGVGPWTAIDQYAADPRGAVAAWTTLAGLRERLGWCYDHEGNKVTVGMWERVAAYALDWRETFERNYGDT